MDSIVNFGENLPDHELQKAFMHAKQADLCIVLGSSLRVTPAADIPEEVAKRGKLVICNLQQTPLDDCASLAIYAKCDDVMLGLANDRLSLDIPPFKVRRQLQFTSKPSHQNSNHYTITITGLDESSDIPYLFIQAIDVTITDEKNNVATVFQRKVDSEPIVIQFEAKEGTVEI
jgi:mono-ADP-ribosyltransferase sirtuin 6